MGQGQQPQRDAAQALKPGADGATAAAATAEEEKKQEDGGAEADNEEGESSYYDTEEESDQEEKDVQAAIAASLGEKPDGHSAVYQALGAADEASQEKQAA